MLIRYDDSLIIRAFVGVSVCLSLLLRIVAKDDERSVYCIWRMIG